jgi:hypothetical protein
MLEVVLVILFFVFDFCIINYFLMNDSLNELIRRVEILSEVMNNNKKGKADYAVQYNVAEVTVNRDLEWLRSLGIEIFSRGGKVTLLSNPPKEILNQLAADYLPLKLNSDVFKKKVKIFSKLKNENYFNHLTLASSTGFCFNKYSSLYILSRIHLVFDY